jgi:hypothetical protein
MARNVFDQRLTTSSQQALGVRTLSLPLPHHSSSRKTQRRHSGVNSACNRALLAAFSGQEKLSRCHTELQLRGYQMPLMREDSCSGRRKRAKGIRGRHGAAFGTHNSRFWSCYKVVLVSYLGAPASITFVDCSIGFCCRQVCLHPAQLKRERVHALRRPMNDHVG